MNQYIIQFSIKGYTPLELFLIPIDITLGKDANQTTGDILQVTARKYNAAGYGYPHPSKVEWYDIVINMLVKLN